MGEVRRALISVSDKTGVVEFASQLVSLGVEIISTGGTARLLKESNLPVKDISEFTGFPEMLGGRVKTLHPKVHAGILALRDNPEHVKQASLHNIEYIDLVAVNLYPFEATIQKPDVTLAQAIENIDIGGPTMLRSAAKNYPFVTVISNPDRYDKIIGELRDRGNISLDTNLSLAQEVFAHTSNYDALINSYLSEQLGKDSLSEQFSLIGRKKQDLRYGENPHQKAAFYVERSMSEPTVPGATQLQGKELSFNNILDLNSALEIAKDFDDTVSVVIKHTNPCGVALGESVLEAYKRARSTDPVSAFGSVLGFNRTVGKAVAEEIISTFVEAVIAPDFDEEALAVFSSKANLRILKTTPFIERSSRELNIKKVVGGFLVQERDLKVVAAADLKVVTKRQPSQTEVRELLFAWKVCRAVKSNAIVYVKDFMTVGVGAGQMSRVDSSKIAVAKANFDLNGSVLASDAFFPFRDGVDAAAEAGAVAVIQPGGSMRDEEVIKAADEHGMAMVFTGVRHFNH